MDKTRVFTEENFDEIIDGFIANIKIKPKNKITQAQMDNIILSIIENCDSESFENYLSIYNFSTSTLEKYLSFIIDNKRFEKNIYSFYIFINNIIFTDKNRNLKNKYRRILEHMKKINFTKNIKSKHYSSYIILTLRLHEMVYMEGVGYLFI